MGYDINRKILCDVTELDIQPGPKTKVKKEVVVQHRYVGERKEDHFLKNMFESMREWHHFRKYSCIEDAEKGIKAMERKDKKWEYRIGDGQKT